LHTRTSTSEQHCSSSILKVFLNIPDSKIPWDGITVGYFRFPLAEHWSSYYCEIILSTTNIDFFYSRTFQHLFRRFDVTLHSPLKIRQAR
jgi:hypothetical protein